MIKQKTEELSSVNALIKLLQEERREYMDKINELLLELRRSRDVQISSKMKGNILSWLEKSELNSEVIAGQVPDPVPNDKVFQFTHKQHDIKKQSDAEDEIFTNSALLEILEIAKKRNFRDFMIFSFLIITGARISEILTIQIEHINLERRFFETGFIKNARKSTLISNKSLLFFFTEKFSKYLETYLNYLDKGEVWLFPGRSKYYHYNSFHRYIKKNYGDKYSNTRKFRKTLITNRVKMGCPLWASEGLKNHKRKEGKSKMIKTPINFFCRIFGIIYFQLLDNLITDCESLNNNLTHINT